MPVPEQLASLPFDALALDDLMSAAGVDVLLSTSRHNVRYLLGGRRFFFFAGDDAFGPSRYLPVLVYKRGRADASHYVGFMIENYQDEHDQLWVPSVANVSRGSRDAVEHAIRHLQTDREPLAAIGVEQSFLPMDAYIAMREGLPGARIVDCTEMLEELREVKRADELASVREAAERVNEAISATFSLHGEGATKYELAETVREQITARGMTFAYALVAIGSDHNRAPSAQPWLRGECLSIDAGGDYHGYMADVARVATLGEPDANQTRLLDEVDRIQQAARAQVRPGATGRDVWNAAQAAIELSSHPEDALFEVHGIGLVSHERPRITVGGAARGPDADEPLQPGAVLSIETLIAHERGYMKLEDTLAVTPTGSEAFGDENRGWQRGRTR